MEPIHRRAPATPSVRSGSRPSALDGWVPSNIIPMVVNELAAEHENAIDVRLRFTPHGAGAWTIDNVWVDPFKAR